MAVREWTAITDGVWSCTKDLSNGFKLVTVALTLADGSLLIYSPTARLGDDTHAALKRLGTPSVFLAPNHFHNLGLAEWTAKYPDAIVVSSETALPRLKRQAKGVSFHPLSALTDRLAPDTRLLTPDGTKAGEVWLEIRRQAACTWIVSDAWFNLPAHPTGVQGVICRLLSVSSGLRVGKTWTLFALSDKTSYKRWVVEHVNGSSPTQMMCSHGALLSGSDTPKRLLAALEARI